MLQIRVFRPPSTSWYFSKLSPTWLISLSRVQYINLVLSDALCNIIVDPSNSLLPPRKATFVSGGADEECSVVRNPRSRTFRHCQCAGNLNLKEEEKHPEPSPTYDSMILWSETLPSKNRTFRHCHRALNPTLTIVIVLGTQHHPDQFRWRQKPPLLN